jgi:hypothetical protein
MVGVPEDPGCYEERYRLTGRAAVGLVAGLLSAGLGALWQLPLVSAAAIVLAVPVIFAVFSVVLAIPEVVASARRMIAFRADYAGVTLGAVPDNMTFLRSSAVFVPWADVERITLRPQGRDGRAEVQSVAIRRREGAMVLAQRGKVGPGYPVPGGAAEMTRRVTGWRLNRERLAAVIAAVAPAVPIIDAGPGDPRAAGRISTV